LNYAAGANLDDKDPAYVAAKIKAPAFNIICTKHPLWQQKKTQLLVSFSVSDYARHEPCF
jgi:hypothetical protein